MDLRPKTAITCTPCEGRGIQGGQDSASANVPLFFHPLYIRRNQGFGVPNWVKWRKYPGDIWGAFQPIVHLLQLGWTGGQVSEIKLG